MRRLFSLTTGVLLTASAASAQITATASREIDAFVSAVASGKEDAIEDAVANLVASARVKAVAIDGKAVHRDFMAFRRADVQNGAGAGATGTTAAVASPLLPAIFGVAFESGALTRSVSGNTITLKAAPAGLFCAAGTNAAAVAGRDPEACRTFWRRFGVTATFDTSRGEKSETLSKLAVIENQFSEITVRAELLNRRGARPEAYFDQRAQAFVNTQAEFALATSAWTTATQDAVLALVKTPAWATSDATKRREQVGAALDAQLKTLTPPPAMRGQWLDTLRADARSDFNRVVMTAEYAFTQADVAAADIGTNPVIIKKGQRPPSLHTARFIYGQGLGDRSIELTGNASVSWFDHKPAGVDEALRDIRASGEVKFRLREIASYGAPALSFAGLYAFLNQEPLGLGLTAFNAAEIKTRGHIRLFQAKLELPTANNAMRIPLSFSASNRTELIKETDVRGQIGLSFNLDALFATK